MSEMNENNNKCPGCGRHCDLSAPNCPRGEAIARGEAPMEKEHEGRRHGHEGHGRHHRPMAEEEYLKLDTNGKLDTLLRELHHMSRFGMESRGGQGRILQILAQDGDMTQRVLTEKLGIQPGSASEVIGKLERAGYITRTESTEDRRTVDVRLTESGKEHLNKRRAEKPDLFSALSEEEKEQLVGLLEKLHADWKQKFVGERHGKGKHHMPEE